MGNFEEILSDHLFDIEDLNRDFSLQIGDNPIIVEKFRPRVSYDLLFYGKDSKICFSSPNFLKEDFHIYFQNMIEVSKTTLGDLMNGNTLLDFKIYPSVNRKLKEIFFSVMGTRARAESIPAFGRIGLYNSENGKGKAPRIFFVVGHYATLHIIACDPEHDIYDGS